MANDLFGIFWDNIFDKTAMWGDFSNSIPHVLLHSGLRPVKLR